jgi:hypothetical protein
MERPGLKCNFCGMVKPGGVVGPTTDVYICPACVELTYGIVHAGESDQGGRPTDDKLVRWLSEARTQLGTVSNLFLALSTGILAIATQRSFSSGSQLHGSPRGLLFVSVLVASLSLLWGGCLSIVRLYDARLTAKMVRLSGLSKRVRSSDGKRGVQSLRDRLNADETATWTDLLELAPKRIGTLRKRTKRLGWWTWRLLSFQVALTVIGAALFGAASMARLLHT